MVNYSVLSLKPSLELLFIVFEVNNVKFDVKELALAEKFLLDFLAHFADPAGLTVVGPAIVEHQFYIFDELPHIFILVCFQFLFDGAEVHRIFDDVFIVSV